MSIAVVTWWSLISEMDPQAPTQPTEVAFVLSDLASGGAQRAVTTVVNAWGNEGRRVCVITLASPSWDFFELHPSVERLVIGAREPSSTPWHGLLANLRRIKRLRRAVKQSGAPIVVGFVSSINVLVVLAALGLGLRVVISERNDPERQRLGMMWGLLRHLFYRFADVATANSAGVIESMSTFVPRRKLAFLPNPLAFSLMANDYSKTSPTILSVGRLNYQKGYDVLLEAFAAVSRGNRQWRLAVVGAGGLEAQLRAQASRLAIEDRVDWHGEVKDPFPYYRNARVFVLASRHEGMPNAMLEAMSCALPVVVTDASPGPLEFVEHEISGLVVPVADVPALAEALERLIGNPDLGTRLGEAAMSRVAGCALGKVLPVWERVLGLNPSVTV